MKPRQHPSADLRALMSLQEQQASISQARALGLSEKAVRRLVDEGTWARTAPGVYTSQPGVANLSKSAWAGHLSVGGESAIGGDGALQLSGIPRRVDQLELWVPPELQRRAVGFVVRRDHLGRLSHARGTLP